MQSCHETRFESSSTAFRRCTIESSRPLSSSRAFAAILACSSSADVDSRRRAVDKHNRIKQKNATRTLIMSSATLCQRLELDFLVHGAFCSREPPAGTSMICGKRAVSSMSSWNAVSAALTKIRPTALVQQKLVVTLKAVARFAQSASMHFADGQLPSAQRLSFQQTAAQAKKQADGRVHAYGPLLAQSFCGLGRRPRSLSAS
mmetsp:Transcript_16161/g.39926  ORF Transcript_16161/g.39926 Transcript_16161/m.39926 type:complete len:203 (+) Transcript_16161:569-1177(+)